MKVLNTELKDDVNLQLEEFNDCPGGYEVKKALDELVTVYNFVDVDESATPYWQNDSATLVIGWIIGDNELERALGLGKVAKECRADEFDYMVVPVMGGKMLVVRMWWD